MTLERSGNAPFFCLLGVKCEQSLIVDGTSIDDLAARCDVSMFPI